MLATRLTCPHCAKELRVNRMPHPGKRVVCPACQRRFEAPAASVLAPDVTLPDAPPVRRGLLLAIVVGGLVLLVGCTAVAIGIAARSDDAQVMATSDADGQFADATAQSAKGTVPEESARPDRPDDPGRAPPAVAEPGAAPPDRPKGPDRPIVPRGSPPALEAPPGDTVAASSPERGWLPSEMQGEVNKAIDRGVAYLKEKQYSWGSWEESHPTAYAALPALTLLECGVPADDPRVQKAANFVRAAYTRPNQGGRDTYNLSLALLFLERLGDKRDMPIIRTIALRLVAGQTADGGWTYRLPTLTANEQNRLEDFLTKTRPHDLGRAVQLPDGRRLDPAVLRPDNQKPLDRSIDRGQGKSPPGQGKNPSGQGKTQSGQGTNQERGTQPSPHPGNQTSKSDSSKKCDDAKKKGDDTKKLAAAPKKTLSEDEAFKLARKLPVKMHTIPSVLHAARKSALTTVGRGSASDNSNTQFATLALWAASRHDLPLERALDVLAKRFQASQRPNGTWGYHPSARAAGGSPAMTGAGLLGLAVGHGVSAGTEKVKDPRVEKGFHALSEQVGKPLGAGLKGGRLLRNGRVGRIKSPINLYFLWTVERVGVLYDVRQFDGKDWYRWGVELLLDSQRGDGAWEEGNFVGSSRTLDTCLALLFLKRANLSSDLSKKLEFVIQGKSAAGSPGPP